MGLLTATEFEQALKKAGGDLEVSLGDTTTYGKYREIDEAILGEGGHAEVIGTATTVLIATGSLPGIDIGTYPTVDGTKYRVRDLRKEDDGGLTRLFLSDVETS